MCAAHLKFCTLFGVLSWSSEGVFTHVMAYNSISFHLLAALHCCHAFWYVASFIFSLSHWKLFKSKIIIFFLQKCAHKRTQTINSVSFLVHKNLFSLWFPYSMPYILSMVKWKLSQALALLIVRTNKLYMQRNRYIRSDCNTKCRQYRSYIL